MPQSATQARTRRVAAQARENELCRMFGDWRRPRQLERVLPPLGSADMPVGFAADIDFNATIVPVDPKDERKRRGRKAKP